MTSSPRWLRPPGAENAEIKAGFKSSSLRTAHRNEPTAPNSKLICINIRHLLY
jgi:hypothetical protein